MKKGMHIIGSLILLLTLFSFILIDKSHSGSEKVIESDSVFLQEAASSGLMEIALGKIAEAKAINPRVRAFGAMMVRDHTAANAELGTVARNMSLVLPKSPITKHLRHITHMEGLSGTTFDRAYINMMVDAHKDDIDEFEDASKKASNEAVRSFAGRTYPILVMHRDSAIAIRKR